MKITVRFLGMVLVISLMLLGAFFFVLELVVIPMEEDSMVSESMSIGYYIRETLPYLNPAERQQLLEKLVVNNPDLSYVVIEDSDGRAIAHSDPTRIGMVFNDTGTLAGARYGDTVRQVYTRDLDNQSSPHYGERTIDLLIPYNDSAGVHSGAINVGLSMKSVDEVKTSYRSLIIVVGVLVITTMTVMSYLTLRTIIQPLNRIVEATRKFHGEPVPARLPEEGDEELKVLAVEFNAMSDRIHGLVADLSGREKDLQESGAYLNAVVYGSPIPQFVIDAGHRVLFWNKAMENFTGIRAEDVIGTDGHWKAFFSTRQPTLVDLLIDDRIDDGREIYQDRFISSRLIEGAYETTRYLERMKKWLHITAIEIRNAEGAIIGGVETIDDITDRKQTEVSLTSSENLYRAIFNNTGAATIIIDSNTIIRLANPGWEKLTGVQRDDQENRMSWRVFIDSGDVERMTEYHYLRRQDPSLAPKVYECKLIDATGNVHNCFVNVDVIPGTSDSVASLVDVTDLKKAEAALRKSEQNYRSILENIQEAYYRSDIEGNMIMASPSAASLLGYDSVQDLIGKNIAKTFYKIPEDREKILEALRLHGSVSNYETTLKKRDGTIVLVSTNSHRYYDARGNYQGVEGIFRDITERKKAEEKLLASLHEKEVLLKEIHHRVKNNLQIISSMINLQASRLSDRETIEALMESQNRIRTMALVHEKLYRSPDLGSVDFGDYTRNLATYLFHTYMAGNPSVRLDLDLGHVSLNIDQAIPAGLIVNELVTNALKHAFPGGRAGRLAVSLEKSDDNIVTIKVSDDGIGLPDSFKVEDSMTLGLQLVRALVEQLNGSLDISSDTVTCFTVKFREERDKAAARVNENTSNNKPSKE